MPDPTIVLLEEVARALGDVLDEVVFIGGVVAPLLQVERHFRAPRPTTDVDAIVATATYSGFERLCVTLRGLGFREVLVHAHRNRWIAPGALEVPFDLVPVGEHPGAGENRWGEAVMETATRFRLPSGLIIRHASAPAFLALKFAAFHDRGIDDPHSSHDLEDILALVASRPGVGEDVQGAPESIKDFVAEQTAEDDAQHGGHGESSLRALCVSV